MSSGRALNAVQEKPEVGGTGFVGRARTWWKAALILQAWHFVEHALLLGQATTAKHLFGAEVPTSVVQFLVSRVELHLSYNGIVTIFLLVGAFLRMIEQRSRRNPSSGQAGPRPWRPIRGEDSGFS